MKLVIYGAETERGELQQLLTQLPACGYRDVRVEGYGEYDRFIAGLRESPPDCIVVTMNGAGGMEGVIAACRLCGAVPVVRFSGGSGFAVQSYRLGSAYFHEKPLATERLSAACWGSGRSVWMWHGWRSSCAASRSYWRL